MEKWKVWDENEKYGETLYKRATGELPEMESSKALAKIVNSQITKPNRILDVGCGAGHYLRSLRREFGDDFFYCGIDATKQYINLASKAFENDKNASFKVSDVFDIEIDDRSYDLVMSCNLLLHLPSIEKPIEELVRVTDKVVIIRLLCGNRSFRIQDVHPQKDGLEFAENGEPVKFHYYNIYSKEYLESIFKKNKKIKSYEFIEDQDYNDQRIINSIKEHVSYDATTILNGFQVNGYILQPWVFVIIQTN